MTAFSPFAPSYEEPDETDRQDRIETLADRVLDGDHPSTWSTRDLVSEAVSEQDELIDLLIEIAKEPAINALPTINDLHRAAERHEAISERLRTYLGELFLED